MGEAEIIEPPAPEHSEGTHLVEVPEKNSSKGDEYQAPSSTPLEAPAVEKGAGGIGNVEGSTQPSE